jgi:hypothetical protein
VGNAPLPYASFHNSTDAATVLLSAGADLDIRNARGWMALYYAAEYCDPDVVAFFLKHGADFNVPDNGHRKPVWVAASRLSGSMGSTSLELLISAGAEITPTDAAGWNALLERDSWCGFLTGTLIAHGLDLDAVGMPVLCQKKNRNQVVLQ